MIVELQKGRVLRMYGGVVYELSMLGGYSYAILMRKSVEFGGLLLVLCEIHKLRPMNLDRILKPMLGSDEDRGGYYMMFFPVSIGLRRGLLKSVGIIRDIDRWEVPAMPEGYDVRVRPWYWSMDKGWEFVPSGLDNRQLYRISNVCLLRLFRGKDRGLKEGKLRGK